MGKYESVRALASGLADSPEPTFVVALDGTIVAWNPAAAELFDVPAWQAIGQPCQAIIAGATAQGDAVCCAACVVLREAAAGRSAPATDLVATLGRPARRRWLRVHVVGLKDAEGQPQGVLHLVEDVHERRTRERVGERFLALTANHGNGAGNVEVLLTRRERDVFRLLAGGQTAREVAACLGIQHATARTHIQRILAKLGAHNRVAALSRVLEGDREEEAVDDTEQRLQA
ncbi:MAG: helix-turn-helix transcriptional regulator [Chloroflexi bacterium]|nr:helix-turn-helix transcriptional regulator [Chloroflexota bacterium]